ncbi:MAG TPA: DNA internalization-related competence protein ComEC/Rec2 [Syntrophomonadaceae bacterium]|nr:DNA internalization-related competence protein ComEC/Rec2 [Syntrophomonadaceae bacterium]
MTAMRGIWFKAFGLLALAVLLVYYQLWWLAFVLLLCPLLLTLVRRDYAGAALICFLVLAGGLLYVSLVLVRAPGDAPDQEAQMEGVIIKRPQGDGSKCSFVFQPDHPQPHQEKIQVFCYFPAQLEKGQRVTLQGIVRRPDPAGNPGEFDYRAYLSYDRIFYILNVKSPGDLTILGRKASVWDFLERYRQLGVSLIRNTLPADEASIFIGMLLGQTEGIDPQEYQDFQKTGIVHIFSVSGMHVGFLALLCSGAASLLGFSRRRTLFSSIGILLLYGTMVDWPAPVVRSVIMASLGLLAYYSGRERELLDSLGLSGLVILLINPTALFQISFQLSFLATWGLIYLFPSWRQILPRRNWLTDLALIPLAAQAAVLPLIAYYFYILSPVSILANLLLAYLTGGIVVIGFIFLLVGVLFTTLGTCLLDLSGALIELTRLGNRLLLQAPGAYLWVAAPSALAIGLYYGGLLLASLTQVRRAWMTGICLLGVFLIIICLPASWYNRGQAEVVFVDVGQGDCTLLKTPEGDFIMVDGGGSAMSDVGARKVLPYLRYRGIGRLYLAISTHPDVDHLAGLQKVLEEIPADAAAIPASLVNHPAYDSLKALLKEKNIPLLVFHQGQQLQEGDWRLRVLYAGDSSQNPEDTNQQSMALKCEKGQFSVFLTADINQAALQEMDKDGLLQQTTVLKLPHHGSRYSLYPPLYEKTRPRYGIISVGAHNTFGHPSPDVLQALGAERIPILRTDQSGAIAFTTQGDDFSLTMGP